LAGLTGNVSGIASASGIGAFSEGGGNIASGNYSHAEGLGTKATSTASHSEGISTIASNLASHAEGIATRAIGVGSHAEGGGSIASGNYSHAEGDPCVASGYASHAEGIGCTASGTGSHAEGSSTIASGLDSHAGGANCVASGDYSFAHGRYTEATGTASVAIGYAGGGPMIASGRGSFCLGDINGGSMTATSFGSFSMGRVNSDALISTTDIGSFSMGYSQNGSSIECSSQGCLAIGYADGASQIQANNAGGIAGGFMAGGDSIAGRGCFAHGSSFVGTVQATDDGAFAHGAVYNGALIEATFAGAVALGTSTGTGSIQSQGNGSLAIGNMDGSGTLNAQGNGSFSLGQVTNGIIEATNPCSVAFGYVTNSSEQTTNAGYASLVVGRDARIPTGNDYSLLIGQYGTALTSDTSSSNTVQGLGSIQIASGNNSNTGGTGGNTGNRDISVIIGTQTFGAGSIGGGIANFWNSGGADYAEYFEWADGMTGDQDRVGMFASMDTISTDKIMISPDTQSAIGIVSSAYSLIGIIGDSAELKWKGINMRDTLGRALYQLSYVNSFYNILNNYSVVVTDQIKQIVDNSITSIISHENDQSVQINEFNNFVSQLETISYTVREINSSMTGGYDRYIISNMDDTTQMFADFNNANPIRITVVNPAYNPSMDYIPRSARKEWTPVSLLGKVYVRDDGTCIPGQKCDCINGIATNGTTWRVLKRMSTNVIKILLK